MPEVILQLLSLFLLAALCRSAKSTDASLPALPWDAARATNDLKVFSASPHPLGSVRIQELADYIEQQMRAKGIETGRDSFTATVPNPEFLIQTASPMQITTLAIPMQNVFAKVKTGSESCALLVGSHYDSKRLASGEGVGANDSGSSSVAVLELMRGLQALKPSLRCHVVGIWFDGEEAYLPEWRDGETRHPARIVDNTYGSRHLADSLEACGANAWCLPKAMGGERVEGLILLDMVGMPDLRLTPESSSTPAWLAIARELDQAHFGGRLYGRSSAKPIEDDHIPFLRKGIPALDLIGFEALETWHQPTDTFESVSMKSIEESVQLTAALLQRILGPEGVSVER